MFRYRIRLHPERTKEVPIAEEFAEDFAQVETALNIQSAAIVKRQAFLLSHPVLQVKLPHILAVIYSFFDIVICVRLVMLGCC